VDVISCLPCPVEGRVRAAMLSLDRDMLFLREALGVELQHV